MLEDARAAVLLTQRNLEGQLVGPSIQNPKPVLSRVEVSKIQNRSVVCLDKDWERSLSRVEKTLTASDPGNFAYVIYTSGSTGDPRGS